MRRLVWMFVFAAAAAGCRSGSRRVGGDAAGTDVVAPQAPVAPAAVATVPDLRGLTVGMARAAISSAGYALGSISYVVDAGGHPPGTVVAQRPAHGAPSPRGVSVELRVAAGAGQGETTTAAPQPDLEPAPGTWTPGTVPVLAGLSLADATDLAHRAGYEIVVLRVPGRPLGTVLSQDVPAGKAAPAGTPLGLRVAVGGDGPTVSVPKPVASAVSEVTVPGVLDRTSAQAHRILEDAGLSVREERADAGPEGRVVDQRPSAGERVKKGTEVAIVVPGAAAEAPVAPAAPPVPEMATAPTPAAPPVEPPGGVGSPDGPIGSPDGPAPAPRARPALPPTPPAPPAPESPPSIPPVPPAPESPPSIPPVPPAPPSEPPAPPPVPAEPPSIPPVPPVPPSEPPAAPPTPAPDSVPHARPKDDLTVPPDASAPASPPPVPVPESPPAVPPAPPAPESPPSVPPVPPMPSAPESAPPAPAPVPAPAPGSSSSPSPSDGPIEIPAVSSPEDGVTLVGAKLLSVDLSWGEIAGASGYVVEVEELTGNAWTPILRKVVKSASISMEIEPADPRNGEFRWRVRTVVGRRGGRAAPWRTMHVR